MTTMIRAAGSAMYTVVLLPVKVTKLEIKFFRFVADLIQRNEEFPSRERRIEVLNNVRNYLSDNSVPIFRTRIPTAVEIETPITVAEFSNDTEELDDNSVVFTDEVVTTTSEVFTEIQAYPI